MMKFSENFYPNVISCKTKEGTKDFYDVAFQKESKKHILGQLSKGAYTKYYYQLGSQDAFVQDVLKELDQMYDGKATAAFTGEYVLEDWGRHEFTRGTWSSSLLSKSKIEELNRPLKRQVYFVGGANDIYRQGGVPGTIFSGHHGVNQLLSQA